MDLNKHIVNNDNCKPFHSNGYARVANGDRIGSVGNVPFSQRQNIDNNRQTVDLYKRSVVGSARGVLRAKQYIRPTASTDTNKNNNSLQQNNSAKPVIEQFIEPSSRGYNPFA